MEEGLSQSALRSALILASLAAVLVLAGIFGDTVSYVCVGVIVLATLFTAGERKRSGGGWWMILGVGAGLSLAGVGIAQLVDGLGGLIAVIGGALVVIGSVVGFPDDTV